eukprot:4348797-Alexandrium_andersonii.AAC.1
MDAAPAIDRRRKTAAERRAQARRAEARMVSRLLQGFASLDGHRGNALTKAARQFANSLRPSVSTLCADAQVFVPARQASPGAP